MTRVLVSGATGKLGAPICAAISAADDLVLAGRVARSLKGDGGFATLYVAISGRRPQASSTRSAVRSAVPLGLSSFAT